MADVIPNNTSTTYALNSVGDIYSSAIDVAGDSDWFRVTLTAGWASISARGLQLSQFGVYG